MVAPKLDPSRLGVCKCCFLSSLPTQTTSKAFDKVLFLWFYDLSFPLPLASPVHNLRFCRLQAAGWISAQLATWYSEQRQAGHKPSEVNLIQHQMFGSNKKPVIKTKGHETIWLFRFFAQRFLPEHAASLAQGRQLLACAAKLYEWSEFLDKQPDCPSRCACGYLETLCIQHLVLLKPAGIKAMPKHHLFWHMTERTRRGHSNRMALTGKRWSWDSTVQQWLIIRIVVVIAEPSLSHR